jgi:hypothetical protein
MGGVSEGADDFRLLALRLKNMGETGLRRELDKAISHAAEPVLTQIRTELPDRLPDRYAAVLDEDLRLSLSRRTGIDTPGITLRGTTRGIGGRRRIRRLDTTGALWHPLFGNRRHWYGQTSHVRAGFFTGPAEHSAPAVRDAILRAMRGITDQLTRKA